MKQSTLLIAVVVVVSAIYGIFSAFTVPKGVIVPVGATCITTKTESRIVEGIVYVSWCGEDGRIKTWHN